MKYIVTGLVWLIASVGSFAIVVGLLFKGEDAITLVILFALCGFFGEGAAAFTWQKLSDEERRRNE